METNPPDESTAAASARRRLRYAGTCVLCGTRLAKGTEAIYAPATRTLCCLACPTSDADGEPAAVVDVGVAGASARREYERRKNGREERVRGRLGNRLARVVLALTDEPQSTRAWTRGARGEEKLAASLADLPGVTVLHDRRVPRTRGNIDHLVIAPAGVFVVDAKRYEGQIRVRDKGGLFRTDLRPYVGTRDCSHLAENMGWQVAAVEQALSAALHPASPVTPVLCFVDGEWPLLRPPTAFRGVRLETTRSIRRLLSATSVLDEAELDRATRALAVAFPPK